MRHGLSSLLLTTTLGGCSEYEFGSGAFNDLDVDGTADDAVGDDASDDPATDTFEPTVEEDREDPCYQDDHGYDVSPAARLIVDGSEPVVVTFTASDSAYNDELWLEAPWLQALGVGGETAPGTVYAVGTIPEGTELTFGINVRNTGDHFQSGPASRNADGVTHVAMTYAGQCAWTVGFEDLWGGGDQDYNDVELTIEGRLYVE